MACLGIIYSVVSLSRNIIGNVISLAVYLIIVSHLLFNKSQERHSEKKQIKQERAIVLQKNFTFIYFTQAFYVFILL